MKPNLLVARGIAFHGDGPAGRYRVVGMADTTLRIVGIAIAFVAGHLTAFVLQRYLAKQRG